MASRKSPRPSPRGSSSSTTSPRGGSSSTADDDHDGGLHAGIPQGSSLFKEVLAELQPAPELLDPPKRSPRRRRSTVRHVHYEVKTDGTGGQQLVKVDGVQADAVDSDDDLEEERQILHGKCHCYFVKNGNVTGLADQKCHHEHRNHALGPSPSPSPHASPRTPRKHGLSPRSTPEGSPRSRPTLAPLAHPSSLAPPGTSGFRARSHSDCSAMARVSTAKRAGSLVPLHGAGGLTNNNNNNNNNNSAAHPRHTASKGQHGPDDLAGSLATSLRLTSAPPPIFVQEATALDVPDFSASDCTPLTQASRVRRSSAHAIPSDELHYLYNQFLTPAASSCGSGSGGGGVKTSGQRPYSGSSAMTRH